MVDRSKYSRISSLVAQATSAEGTHTHIYAEATRAHATILIMLVCLSLLVETRYFTQLPILDLSEAGNRNTMIR
jgi:hypothetical protein